MLLTNMSKLLPFYFYVSYLLTVLTMPPQQRLQFLFHHNYFA